MPPDDVILFPERLPSEMCDQPILMPEPLLSQVDKLRYQHAQQLRSVEQKHMEALGKLSEAQSNFDRQLRQQQVAQESAVGRISAQHATDVRQIINRHTAALTQALNIAQADCHLQLAEQQSLHEQALRGHDAELSRQARKQWIGMTAHHEFVVKSLRAQHDRQLKHNQARLYAEHQADMETFRRESASAYEKNVAALQSKVQLAQREAEVLRSDLIQERLGAEQLRAQLACLKSEVEAFQAAPRDYGDSTVSNTLVRCYSNHFPRFASSQYSR